MIGVFDSGSGGLTILHKLQQALPERQFLYLGDHIHAPYGARSEDEIYHLTCASLDRMMRMGCRLVVLACNTASVTMLKKIQQEWLVRHYPENRVIGVFVPLVEFLTGKRWNGGSHLHDGQAGKVALFATPATVKSGAFSREIAERGNGLEVREGACPALVKAIEDHACPDVIDALVETYVRQLEQGGSELPNHAILGCTHFPLVKESFARILPDGCQLVSQPDVVAESLIEYLERHRDLVANDINHPRMRFLTTGSAEKVSMTASHYLARKIRFETMKGAI